MTASPVSTPTSAVPRRILPAIALSQFAGTSLWFAINAVMADLQRESGLPDAAVGWFTAAVQLGFIAGTLGFALWTIADRFSPRLVFLVCSLAGAACAALCAWLTPDAGMLIVLRFLTGVFLAGIYPVGMKIAAGWYAQGLGWALGVLVGALVLGTALPFGLRAFGAAWPWQGVMWCVAVVAALGGVVMATWVPDGPHLAPPAKFSPRALLVIVQDRKVRASAFGYFGHMWELYAFFVLLPLIAAQRWDSAAAAWWVFAGIAAGAISCVAGGVWARRFGSARVAAWQLGCSGSCALLSPWLLEAPPWAWGSGSSSGAPPCRATRRSSARSPPATRRAPRSAVFSRSSTASAFRSRWPRSPASCSWRRKLPLAQVLPWLAFGPVLGLWSMKPLLLAAKLKA